MPLTDALAFAVLRARDRGPAAIDPDRVGRASRPNMAAIRKWGSARLILGNIVAGLFLGLDFCRRDSLRPGSPSRWSRSAPRPRRPARRRRPGAGTARGRAVEPRATGACSILVVAVGGADPGEPCAGQHVRLAPLGARGLFHRLRRRRLGARGRLRRRRSSPGRALGRGSGPRRGSARARRRDRDPALAGHGERPGASCWRWPRPGTASASRRLIWARCILIFELAPHARRARAQGWLAAAVAGVGAVAVLLSGPLYARWGEIAYLAMAGMAAAGVALAGVVAVCGEAPAEAGAASAGLRAGRRPTRSSAPSERDATSCAPPSSA